MWRLSGFHKAYFIDTKRIRTKRELTETLNFGGGEDCNQCWNRKDRDQDRKD